MLLRELGADDDLIRALNRRRSHPDLRRVVQRFRAYAEENPTLVLGALSAVVLGAAVVVEEKVRRTRAARKKRSAPKKTPARSAKTSSKRTLIEPHPGDKRYVRRDAKGRIKESVDVGRSLAADRRRTSKTRAKPGAGDKGDR